ncbi:PqqD family protein [Novosphingobium sp.]|uniref:PqqD family protein n=1 Tax=Novosphingobium sp. TaxID=1874826 RepID=UPI0025EE866D|nr:PqqD family protein [Novosphingobium sp.]
MNLHDRLTTSSDVVVRQVGGETVLLDIVSGKYFGLDAVGARVWQLIEGGAGSLIDACDQIGAEYDVPRDVLEQDVLALAGKLVEHGLAAVTG